MLLDRPQPISKPFDPDSGVARELDLAEELARIMARPPRRGAVSAADPAASDASGPGMETAGETEQTREPEDAEADVAEVAPAQPLPAWARSRRTRRLARNARMVGASLIAVTVVAAIVAGAALALFGSPRELAAIKQMLLPAAPAADRM